MTDGAGTTSGKTIAHPEFTRNVDTDATLGLDPWRPLHGACGRLCVQKPKTDAEMQQVGKLWNGRRDVGLVLTGYAAENLEFLRYFPGLERLDVESPIIRTIEGLRHVADSLKEFSLANTTVRVPLRPVAGCAQLESLHLQRHLKDFDELWSLSGLRHLGLSGISLPNLSTLLPFENLRSLFLGFCRPVNLDLIGRFTALEALHIVKMNHLRDLSALALGRNLRRIELAWLPHVETLPDLSELARLEEVEITTMKALRDIAAIARAPALRFLALWDCKSLTPRSFDCLIGHPTLERLHFGVGRVKDNEAIAAMFPGAMQQVTYDKTTPGTYLRRPTA
jgi:hypothetical protein